MPQTFVSLHQRSLWQYKREEHNLLLDLTKARAHRCGATSTLVAIKHKTHEILDWPPFTNTTGIPVLSTQSYHELIHGHTYDLILIF